MGPCKTKVLKKDLGIFTHIQGYPDIIRHIQDLCELCIFRSLTYSEFWYIQNFGILRKQSIVRTLEYVDVENPGVYSEPWHVENLRHTQNTAKHL